jgi:hypothetical protein
VCVPLRLVREKKRGVEKIYTPISLLSLKYTHGLCVGWIFLNVTLNRINSLAIITTLPEEVAIITTEQNSNYYYSP